MQVAKRLIDVELTNRCNALCSFCPRDVTPEQGFMTFDTFKQVVARVLELETTPHITLTGQGESTLHPELVKFIRYAANQGLYVEMTTNANLLDKATARRLVEAGLRSVTFSISDFGQTTNWSTTSILNRPTAILWISWTCATSTRPGRYRLC